MTGDKLLVTGATGNVGGALFRQLQRAGANVRAVVRDRSRLPGDADVAVADLGDPGSLTRAAVGVRAAFVLAGGHDVPGVLDALRSAGVEHVVVLTSRSVIGRVPGNAIADMWARAEAAVTGSGLGFTVLRPSGFASNALRWLPQLRAGDTVRAAFADAPIAVIDPADIAAVAARALVDRSLASQHLELSGPAQLRPAEQLAILGRLLGRELRLIPLTGDAARADLAATFPPAFVDAQLRFFDGGEFDDARVVSTVRDLSGRPARTFAEWATANAAAFQAPVTSQR